MNTALLIIGTMALCGVGIYLRIKWNRTRRVYTANCGHTTKLTGNISFQGGTRSGNLPLHEGRPILCFSCLEKVVIPCAWCEETIFPGDPVTLYTPKDKAYEPPDGSVVYNEDPLQLVGCLRWDCASTGADRAGFLLPTGEIERVMTPIEQVIASGQSVIAQIGDPDQVIVMPTKEP